MKPAAQYNIYPTNLIGTNKLNIWHITNLPDWSSIPHTNSALLNTIATGAALAAASYNKEKVQIELRYEQPDRPFMKGKKKEIGFFITYKKCSALGMIPPTPLLYILCSPTTYGVAWVQRAKMRPRAWALQAKMKPRAGQVPWQLPMGEMRSSIGKKPSQPPVPAATHLSSLSGSYICTCKEINTVSTEEPHMC